MSKRIGEGETSYSLEDARRLRQSLIDLRDYALERGNADWAVQLSHCIGFASAAMVEFWGGEA